MAQREKDVEQMALSSKMFKDTIDGINKLNA